MVPLGPVSKWITYKQIQGIEPDKQIQEQRQQLVAILHEKAAVQGNLICAFGCQVSRDFLLSNLVNLANSGKHEPMFTGAYSVRQLRPASSDLARRSIKEN